MADWRIGLHIYQGGVGLQQLFILVFVAMSVQFQRAFAREVPDHRTRKALQLLYAIYAVLALVTVSGDTVRE